MVAIHIRRGDFGYGKYWIAPPEWYLAWLSAIWPGLDKPVLYVATDDETVLPSFAQFSPWDARSLDVHIPGADFMVDHHVLRNADKVAISNSTFSFTAAMLNVRALTFMRPHPNRRELVPFKPGLAGPVATGHRARRNGVGRSSYIGAAFPRLGDSVVHVGRHCSPWTHLARSILPRMRIHELGEGQSVDRFRREQNGVQITHLVVELLEALSSVVARASDTLSQSAIDMVHFRVPSADVVVTIPRELEQNGYELFVSLDGSLKPVDGGAPLPA